MERGEQGGKWRHYQAPPLPPVVVVADLSGLGLQGPEPAPIRRCRRSIRDWLCMHDVFISLVLSSFLVCFPLLLSLGWGGKIWVLGG